MPLLTTSHMEHALAYHQSHGACPCLPPATWSMPLLTPSHMEHALAHPQPHGACPCLPPATVLRHVAVSRLSPLPKTGKTSSGGQERDILKTQKELPTQDLQKLVNVGMDEIRQIPCSTFVKNLEKYQIRLQATDG